MNIRKITATLIATFVISMMNAQNPFFEKYNTPHETVPFDKIKVEHFEPAILEGMKEQNVEIDQIINNTDAPNFDNTILALEVSGDLLSRVMRAFSCLQGAETNDDLLALAQKMAPALNAHSNNIQLNEVLFDRVKSVYNQRAELNLNIEQNRLLEKTFKNFARSGANLSKEDQQTYRQLSEKLNLLSLKYSQNNLKETNEYVLSITSPEELIGLPEDVVAAALETAKEKGLEGWAFTLHAPSYIPFMKYSKNRELRRELYMAYNTKGSNNNEYNNIDIVKDIVNLRMEIAQLLGYDNFAQYVLTERMAENSDAVYGLLNQLIDAYMPIAQNELNELQELARKDQGSDFTVMPWDWSFYADQLKDQKFNINEEMLRPYFELESVKEGVFGLATKLYGITFKKNNDIPVYHKDVDAYDVFDKDGKFLSVLYTDFHPRAGKRSGAWMTESKGQWIDQQTGENSRPHVMIVMNFTKPTESKPSLLTFDEFETFLHEFGHALHGIFANSSYNSLSGTSVYRDFVELPSQILENYATEEEFLNTFAKHYQTNENIPSDLIGVNS